MKDDQKPGLPDTGSAEGRIEYAIVALGVAAIGVTVGYVVYKRKHTLA
nr:LPXTG cell wall anchor domain-containing protein [Lacticaseibacillus manihotivorans]